MATRYVLPARVLGVHFEWQECGKGGKSSWAEPDLSPAEVGLRPTRERVAVVLGTAKAVDYSFIDSLQTQTGNPSGLLQ